MTDKYKALRDALENIPVSGEWKCGGNTKIISKYQAFVEDDNGEYVILDGNYNFPDHAEKIVKYAVAACPSVIAALLAERDRMRDALGMIATLACISGYAAQSIASAALSDDLLPQTD